MSSPGTYIISDIHGSSKAFYRMLKKTDIDLDRDYLIINGDIVDRGKDSLKLFYEITELRNRYGDHVVIIKGNHELFVEMYLKGTLSEVRYSSEGYGGADTIRELKQLSAEEKEELIHYIEALPIYKVIDSPIRGELVITHSGLQYDHLVRNDDGSINVIKSIEEGVASDEFQFLVSGFIQREAPAAIGKNLDRVLVVGHVPTMFIQDSPGNGIWARYGGKLILLDCGSGYRGGKLGCLRVEDEKLFYV